MKRALNKIAASAFVALAYGGALAQTPSSPATPPSVPSAAIPSTGTVTPPSAPMVVRLEPIAPIQLKSDSDPSWWTRIAPIIAPVLSGLLALGGVWLGLKVGQKNTERTIKAAQRNSEAAINQKANEAELKEIQDKLDTFYGPYLLRSEENRLLAVELRNRQPDATTFRTLTKLLDPAWFRNLSKGDQTIVNEIVANGVELRTLVREKPGTVDSAVLPYLARAGAHFTMLKLAKDGALDNDPARFERYVYPRQLDEVLNADVVRLKRRSAILQNRPSDHHDSLEPLIITRELALPDWPDPPRH
jgi:hypothetical protein